MAHRFEMRRHSAPAGESGQETVHGSLHQRRVVPQRSGFAECLVDDRVERDHPANELAPNGPSVRQVGSGQHQCLGKPLGDLYGNVRE
jgi:hypothetical protein